MVDDFRMRLEAGFGDLLRVEFQVIDARHAAQDVELQGRVGFQKLASFDQIGRIDDDERIDMPQA